MRLPLIAATSTGGLEQWVQIAGAVLILIPFAAAQLGRLDQYGVPYLSLNVVGSASLGVVAAAGSQWGFLLLESVWCGVSAWGLVKPGGPHDSASAG